MMKKPMPAKGMPQKMPGKMAAEPKGKMPAPKGKPYKSGGMMGGKKGC